MTEAITVLSWMTLVALWVAIVIHHFITTPHHRFWEYRKNEIHPNDITMGTIEELRFVTENMKILSLRLERRVRELEEFEKKELHKQEAQ